MSNRLFAVVCAVGILGPTGLLMWRQSDSHPPAPRVLTLAERAYCYPSNTPGLGSEFAYNQHETLAAGRPTSCLERR